MHVFSSSNKVHEFSGPALSVTHEKHAITTHTTIAFIHLHQNYNRIQTNSIPSAKETI
ncbi:hypothetical protein Hanom_Chr04g00294831 [Helianthus anomalus]